MKPTKCKHFNPFQQNAEMINFIIAVLSFAGGIIFTLLLVGP